MNPLVDSLRAHYDQVANTDNFTAHLSFIKELLMLNDPEVLDFHYEILASSIHNIDLYQRLCRAFEKRGQVGKQYLLNRISTESNTQLKGDVLHILGKMNAPEVIPLAATFLHSNDRIMRYKAIIVIGWNGKESELPLLNERLIYEPDDELRGYSATAMRQIWYKHSTTEETILHYYSDALKQEKSEIVISLIVTCVQTLMKKKFGIKETQYGIISGDANKARPKALLALATYFTSK